MKHFKIIGKNKHIPKTYFTKAGSIADAKIHFYLEAGDNISSVTKIDKETFNKEFNG